MHDGNGQRKPLANAERQLGGVLVEIVAQVELLDQLGKARAGLFGRQMEQPRVQIEVLPNRELGVERE